jgi:hypothetical protein
MANICITRHGMALTAMANLLQDKAERICQAWQQHAPKRVWAGLSLEEFRHRIREPLGGNRSIHDYAERAEIILDIVAAIEKDPEAGCRCPLYVAIAGQRSAGPENQPTRLAA